MRIRALLVALVSALLFAGGAIANDEDDWPARDLIHSDVPLYGAAMDNVWPQHFTDDDGSFGCSSKMAFGDWRLKLDENKQHWWRVSNHGVFHCALLFRSAPNTEGLSKAAFRYGFLVRLGNGKLKSKAVELWAFQIGTLPGSDYVLLAREPSGLLIKSFKALQMKCPRANVRTGPSMDVFRSSYCAINSRTDLLTLARSMLKLPALGTLEWTADLTSAPPADYPALGSRSFTSNPPRSSLSSSVTPPP